MPHKMEKGKNGASEQHRRLIIISNRLPFTVEQKGDDIHFRESSGGLITGLSAFLGTLGPESRWVQKHLWVGWPGGIVDNHLRETVNTRALTEYLSYPVYLSYCEMENFYHGFCNKTIWPLFHYFPSFAQYGHEYWEQYRHVTEIFCDSISSIIAPNDVVWIHDYHLMLLPKLLRDRHPDISTGFFLHIPFPSFEMFRLLPGTWRRDLLEGMLGADLIGFHTHDYTQHFLQCIHRILGFEHTMGRIVLPNRIVKIDTFPMGIDFQKFTSASQQPDVASEQTTLQQSLGNVKKILSVDRLDYTKGILNRLQGFESLLEQHPQFRGNVVLLMVIVPSRIAVDQYESMKRLIEELIGKINGKFGSVSWTPIIYQYKNLSFDSLTALYIESEIALITPLRDGMNLIAKEYLSSKNDQTGVLILSEMAGSAQELHEAIIINPNNRQAIADAMKEALEMPADEQIRRNVIMRKRLERYDINRWANDFVRQLLELEDVQDSFNAKVLRNSNKHLLLTQYKESIQRLLLLDYDGTLTPIVRRPEHASPKEHLLKLLTDLSNDKKNTVIVVSGRNRGILEQWLGTLPVHLVAEHGGWIKHCGQEWKLLREQTNSWKERILPILELYSDRLPGAFVEEKEFSVAWHYRNADIEHGSMLARELTDLLTSFTANIDIQILQGNMVVEVRNTGINKGTAALHWLSEKNFDFVLAIGDDATDEDMFRALPETATSIRVGVINTYAKFNLHNSTEVTRLLTEMIEMNE